MLEYWDVPSNLAQVQPAVIQRNFFNSQYRPRMFTFNMIMFIMFIYIIFSTRGIKTPVDSEALLRLGRCEAAVDGSVRS